MGNNWILHFLRKDRITNMKFNTTGFLNQILFILATRNGINSRIIYFDLFSRSGVRSHRAHDHVEGIHDHVVGIRDHVEGIRVHVEGIRDHVVGILVHVAGIRELVDVHVGIVVGILAGVGMAEGIFVGELEDMLGFGHMQRRPMPTM